MRNRFAGVLGQFGVLGIAWMAPLWASTIPIPINDGTDQVSFVSGDRVEAGTLNIMTIGSGNQCSADCMITGSGSAAGILFNWSVTTANPLVAPQSDLFVYSYSSTTQMGTLTSPTTPNLLADFATIIITDSTGDSFSATLGIDGPSDGLTTLQGTGPSASYGMLISGDAYIPAGSVSLNEAGADFVEFYYLLIDEGMTFNSELVNNALEVPVVFNVGNCMNGQTPSPCITATDPMGTLESIVIDPASTNTPEPGTAALYLLGMAGVAFKRLHRGKTKEGH